MSKIPTDPEDKLDAILQHLRNLDRRDRLRTWGAFFRGLLSLIPIIIFLYGAWYITKHGDELLAKMAAEAAKQTAQYATGGSQDILKQMQGLLNK
ncbi:MAG: hypothetical protein WCS85_00510 [Candidatus Peribacteraceae bacterium]|jgi:hypothetical protein